ncbi:MAG TPA: ATP-binding protein [Anaerolineae bacterium]|nr:ATP-binding protein [Anaerolineae bacterium]
MGKRTVLVVDDEQHIIDLARMYLEQEGFNVEQALDGAEALRQIRDLKPALIILDLMLPEIDGWDVCRRTRDDSDVPIIMLTARSDDVDKIVGLELGADDYLTKPFNPRELVARVRAILRRYERSVQPGAALHLGDLTIDAAGREATLGAQPLQLRTKEFATGVVALLVSAGVAFLIARSIAKPLRRITTATEEIARGNYEEQLDITSPEEIRRLATSFNAMAREVEASRQAQRDFVANVSHDLKTPLTSIQGFSQAILDGTAASEESLLRAAQVIHEEADRMTRLVDDLLDLARIEAGQVVMAREPVALPSLLRDCAEKMALRAQQADVRLEVHSEGEPVVAGDRDRLAQVISNLLDNALKHTPSGGRITLTARPLVVETVKRGEPPVSLAEVAVSDTGDGIPPEDLSRIFERFYRGDKSRGKSGRGAGLGLAIVREIVQAHGGKIGAESVLGLGTRITLTLPSLSTRSTDDT